MARVSPIGTVNSTEAGAILGIGPVTLTRWDLRFRLSHGSDAAGGRRYDLHELIALRAALLEHHSPEAAVHAIRRSCRQPRSITG